jgi:hypothetical protein
MKKKNNNPATSLGLKYVVLAFNAWDNINAFTPAPLPVHPIGRSSGFMLVYDTLAQLRKDYPKSAYFEIKPASKEVRHQR